MNIFLYGKPIKYYGYAHCVINTIFNAEYNQNDVFYNLREDLNILFKDAGIKCYQDNKTVYAIEINGFTVFYGFYDWSFSIGFGVHKIC